MHHNPTDNTITKRYLVELSNLAEAFAEGNYSNCDFYLTQMKSIQQSIARLSVSCDNTGKNILR